MINDAINEALKPFMKLDKATTECIQEPLLYCSSTEPVASWKEYYHFQLCNKQVGDVCDNPRCRYMKLVFGEDESSVKCGRDIE